jgi:hypothetical protein
MDVVNKIFEKEAAEEAADFEVPPELLSLLYS